MKDALRGETVRSTAVVAALTTGLLAAGLIASAPVWAVAALVFGAAVAVGYLINMTDNESHITKQVADSLREAAKALEKYHSKDYSSYPLIFMPSRLQS